VMTLMRCSTIYRITHLRSSHVDENLPSRAPSYLLLPEPGHGSNVRNRTLQPSSFWKSAQRRVLADRANGRRHRLSVWSDGS
jgi:hypothetical protein